MRIWGRGNLSHLIIHESLRKRALGRVRLVPRALESRVQGVWKQEGYGFRDLKRQNGSGIEPLLGICQEEARSWVLIFVTAIYSLFCNLFSTFYILRFLLKLDISFSNLLPHVIFWKIHDRKGVKNTLTLFKKLRL